MQTFVSLLYPISILGIYILLGYIVRKKDIVNQNAKSLLSTLGTNLFLPAQTLLVFVEMLQGIDSIIESAPVLLWGCICLVLSLVLACFLPLFFSKEKYERNLFKYGIVFTNFGFFGNALIPKLFNMEIYFYYTIFQIPFMFVLYSWGTSLLIPDEYFIDESNKGIKKIANQAFKTLRQPAFLSMIIGTIIGLVGITLPDIFMQALTGCSNCMAPCAMLVTGFVIAEFPFKSIIGVKKVYPFALLRLVVIPVSFCLIAKMFGADRITQTVVLAFSALPQGLYTIIYPAMYGKDIKLGASMTVVSCVLSLITLPLLFTLLM